MKKRRSISPARRKRILDAYGHSCAIPGCAAPGPYELDHAIALALGGSDEDENLRPLCGAHHRFKTSGRKATTLGSDIFEIAKTCRLIRKLTKPKRQYNWPKNRKIPQRVNPWG